MARVWVVFTPHILADLFESLFKDVSSIQVVPHPFGDVDVIVLPLDEFGQPDLSLLPQPLPVAKLVAVSPTGGRALIRLPGQENWGSVVPFDLTALLAEVQAGRERPALPASRRLPGLRLPSLALRPPAWLVLPRYRPNLPLALTALALALTSALGMGALRVAEASVPGDLLYSFKRLTESAQLALAPGGLDSRLVVLFAERRLEEVETLAERGVVSPDLLQELAATTQAALEANLANEARPAEVVTTLVELTERQQQVLAELQPKAPDPETQAALDTAMDVSASGHVQALAAVVEQSAPSPAPQTPEASTASASPIAAANLTATPSPRARPTNQPASATPESSVVVTTPISSPRPPRPTATHSATPTATPAPTDTATLIPTPIPTATATPSESPTATSTATPPPPDTDTPEPPATETPAASDTPTATATPTETSTPTETPTPSETPTPTNTPTPTATESATPTPTVTPEPTDPTGGPDPRTPTTTSTRTPTATPSATNTPPGPPPDGTVSGATETPAPQPAARRAQ